MLESVPGAAPTVVAAVAAAPVVGAMAFGVAMALVGHVSRSSRVVAAGIAVLFLATAAMVLLAYVDYSGGGDVDPRPKDPKLPGQVYR